MMSKGSAVFNDVACPLRVGCVDMGSNAIRFIIAEFVNVTVGGVR